MDKVVELVGCYQRGLPRLVNKYTLQNFTRIRALITSHNYKNQVRPWYKATSLNLSSIYHFGIIGEFMNNGKFLFYGDFWIMGDFRIMSDISSMDDFCLYYLLWILDDFWILGIFWIIGYFWSMGDI